MATMTEDQTIETFKQLVNMTPSELTRWLKTEESRSVGQIKDGETESVGHQSGEKIVRLLNQKQFSEADIAHMHKVISYIKRHSQQGPTKQDAAQSRWRYSLMNWGHDPLKD
jgi:Protein of unknown function (DUF3140)